MPIKQALSYSIFPCLVIHNVLLVSTQSTIYVTVTLYFIIPTATVYLVTKVRSHYLETISY